MDPREDGNDLDTGMTSILGLQNQSNSWPLGIWYGKWHGGIVGSEESSAGWGSKCRHRCAGAWTIVSDIERSWPGSFPAYHINHDSNKDRFAFD
jgi:hypothetical protein